MTFAEIEKEYGFHFPKKWQDIHKTGSMKWIELTREEFLSDRSRYINDPEAFLMLDCDCEPIFSEDIPERITELNEWLEWVFEERNVRLKDGVRLIPFAAMGTGDPYCFLYDSESSEPKIVICPHDDYSDPDIIAESFDEFLYVILLDAAANDEDIEGEHFAFHLNLLDDEYRSRIQGKSAEELTDEFDSMTFNKADIFTE